MASNNAVVGVLRALLTLDTAEFEKGSRKGQDSAKALSKEFDKFGRQATDLGKTLTAAITLPIAGLAAGAAKLAIDFESSFAGVRKTVDATEPELQALAAGFRALSQTIPINVNELNRLGEAAGALGIPKEEIVDFARVMALLGETTNVTSDQAAESIAQIQTQFKSAGKETENFASALVHLGNNGASTEAQILELTSRLASAGNAAGMSQADVLGFAAAMANVGINAEAGGTALSRTFNEINAAVARGGEDLEKFARIAGVSTAAFAQKFRADAAGAVEDFIVGLGKVQASGGNLITTLDALGITEIRQSDTLRRLALNTDNVTKALDDARLGWRENSALSEEASKRFETVASKLTLLWNRVKDVGITLGQALMPAINAAISAANAFVPAIEAIAKGFGSLPGPIQLAVMGLAGIAAAAGPLLLLAGALSTAMGTLTAAFAANGIAARGMAAAHAVAAGTSTTLAGSIAVLLARFGLLATGAAAGAAAALLHEEAMRKVQKAGEDLATADAKILNVEVELAQARAQGNDKLVGYLAAELAALKRGKELAEQRKKQAEGEAKYAEALEATERASQDRAKADAESAASAKQLSEETKKLRDQLSGAALQADVRKLQAAFDALTPSQRANVDVMRRVGEAADDLHKRGGQLTPELHAIALRFHHIGAEAPKVEGGITAIAAALPNLADKFRASNEAIFQAQDSMRQITIALENYRAIARGEGDPLPFDFAEFTMPSADFAANWQAQIDAAIASAQPLEQLFGTTRVSVDELGRSVSDIGRTLGSDFVSHAGAAISQLGRLQQVMTSTSSAWAAAIPIFGAFVAAGQAFDAAVEDDIEEFGGLLSQFADLRRQIEALGGVIGPEMFEGLTLGPGHLDDSREAVRRLQEALDALNATRKEAERIGSLADALGLGLADRNLSMLTAELPKAFETLKANLDDLVGEGFDFNKVLAKQADQWLELVKVANEFGLEVPESMRPILEQLAKMGLLIDDASQKKIGALKEQLGALDRELTTLRDFVANEAPEEVMGIMEQQARERIAVLEKEKANIESQINDLEHQLTATFTSAAEESYGTLLKLFGQGIEIPIYWKTEALPLPSGVTLPSGEAPEWDIPDLNTGTHGMFPDWGSDGTIVRLHNREAVVPYGQRDQFGGGVSKAEFAELIWTVQQQRRDFQSLSGQLSVLASSQPGRGA